MRKPTIGRNDKCHCGSGKKFKRCCLRKEPEPRPVEVTARRREARQIGRTVLFVRLGPEKRSP